MSRRTPSRQNGYVQGKSLRRKVDTPDAENIRAAGAFILACMSSRLGIYAKLNETTGSLRIKIYDQDDTFEDTLGQSENWIITLGEFAEELSITELYEAFEMATRIRPAESRSEPREGVKATQTLRGAPRGAPGEAETP